ncbi:MAG: choice-of-anchor J domain-containing protein [Bacteroidota bacterium]
MIRLLLFAFLLQANQAVFASHSPSSSALLKGKVTDAATNNPIVGAKITVNGSYTYSVRLGDYAMAVDPPGTYTLTCTKPGFDSYTSAPVNFQSGVVTTINIQLSETTTPCTGMLANLDTVLHHVNLSWNRPAGDYQLLYDDGIEDAFTIWALAGNMNALKITPLAYPANVLGGAVNIGKPADYPAGSNPFNTFQVLIMDAGGSGGLPGSILAGPLDVTPAVYGWNDFTLPSAVNISSGNFYIVMVQGGNPPNAAGLAVDLTTPVYRSYSKNVTGNGNWLPASGNFMMRALMNGPGGPPTSNKSAESVTSYKVWRLRQGEESNPQAWTQLTPVTVNNTIDSAWNNLPCGPYLWSVVAEYPGNRESATDFSNIIGKCWTSDVIVNLTMSCSASTTAGTQVQLRNQVYTDTVYTAICDSSGTVVFHKVWKGSYTVTANKFGYQNYSGSIVVMGPVTDNITLLQRRSPPTHLLVDSLSLHSTWDVPYYNVNLLGEDFSGSFPPQGWTVEGGSNWRQSTFGHPAYSAMFDWTPRVYNYSQSLVSPYVTGINSPILTLKYDIYLDNFSSTGQEFLKIEISDGSSWQTLKTWTNSGGDIQWTTDQLDISSYANKTFRVRFRSGGPDSYQVNGWYIDNVLVYGSESAHLLAPCIYGYNFYLDNVLLAIVTSNNYTIPGTAVKYDSTYTACVVAIYTSGYSASVCTQFTSKFLWPPLNLTGLAAGDTAKLQWQKPLYMIDTTHYTPAGILGYNVYRDDSLLVYVQGPNVLSYKDAGLDPGSYNYSVSAVYDLSFYGHQGQQGNSMRTGPVNVQIHYGLPIPFYEPWDQGSFSFNSWTFPSGPGNWSVSQNTGNPAPSAVFKGVPQETNYNNILESPALDATAYSCATIWLDFDVKLESNVAGGTEKLILDVYYNRMWHQKAEFLNTGNIDWTHNHIDISAVKQKGFKLRFRATGANSSNILNWYVDNISAYPICLPAVGLTGEAYAMDTHLGWSPPQCNGGGTHLNEGFEEQYFPPAGWDRIITNNSATWSHEGPSSPMGVHSGNYCAGLFWDYYHQDEWIIARNIYIDGNLHFWSFAYQGSAHNDHYYVQVSTDHGQSWVTMMDMSALPPFPGTGGYNHWQQPYVVDMSAFLGDAVDIAWHAVDGNNQGLWYYWGIDDCSIGSKKIHLKSGADYYDVYRSEGTAGNYSKINQAPVYDTSYVDPNLPVGQYHYYVQIVNPDCTESLPSDTVMVDVMTSVPGNHSAGIRVYPNPTTGRIMVRSVQPVDRLTVTDLPGKVVMDMVRRNETETMLDLSGLSQGLYILKVFSGSSCSTVKISLTK